MTSNLGEFAISVVAGNATCTAARTLLSNTSVGALVLVGAPPSGNGVLLDLVAMVPQATVTATRADLWDVDTNGNYWPISSVTIPAQTLYTTQAVAMTSFLKADGTVISLSNPLEVAPGHTAACSIAVAFATGINGLARGYSF